MKRVRGLFALVAVERPALVVRNGPPIVVGIGDGKYCRV